MRFARAIFITIAAAVTAAAFAVAGWMDPSPMTKAILPELKDPEIVIRKSARVLEVYDGSRLVRRFSTVLGSSPELDKEIEGDGRTPEGEFYVFVKNPKSRFHLSLGLSYPAADDAERGLADGLISREEYEAIVNAAREKKMPPQKTRLGGEIYIHGGGISRNWTTGCIALENDEMSALFEAIPVGTRVTILK
ncbi:MAG: L,D-transpeptidase [Acidobacteria bacterium]|nr:L,D-transpeptidase [Acidobacteriota bacterium]